MEIQEPNRARWRVGDEVEVRVHSRSGREEVTRGTIVIQDLDQVLRNLPFQGANGPRSPVTQYLLQEAAGHMTQRLGRLPADSSAGTDDEDRIVRLLSMLVGHEPFVTNTLGLSVHQMRRRWPVAADWYSDLVRYILHTTTVNVDDRTAREGDYWRTLTLGEFIRLAVTDRQTSFLRPELVPLSLAIQSMWPDYGPVREAVVAGERRMAEWSGPIGALFAGFGLRLRPGVTLGEVLWAFHTMTTTEEHRQRSRTVSPLFAEVDHAAPGGRSFPYAARTTMLVICGAYLDQSGRPLSLDELYERRLQPPA